GDRFTGGSTASGLKIRANFCNVHGLTIRSFGIGIELFSSSNTVADSFIGTDPYQPDNAGNQGAGIGVYGTNTTIVTNLMSGNGWVGLDIPGAAGTTVQFNYIGTDGAGKRAIPNRLDAGVLFRGGAGNNIMADNLVSGNAGSGIHIEGASFNNYLQ